MSTITGTPTISEVDLYSSNTLPDSHFTLGQLMYGKYGKAFRYVQAGATLVVGNLVQGPAIDTQFDALAVLVGAKDATSLTLTNGTTTITAGQFRGGNIVVNVTPQLAEEYTIIDHTTGVSGATITLYLDRPIRTAMTTSTRLVMRRSPWSGVIQSIATTITAAIAGAVIYPIASGEYGWIQTKGVAAVLADSSNILVGSAVSGGSTATAGACCLNTAGFIVIGSAMQAANSGKPIPVFLTID